MLEAVHVSISQCLHTDYSWSVLIVFELEKTDNSKFLQVNLPESLYFIKSQHPQKVKMTFILMIDSMHNEKFDVVWRSCHIGHVEYVPHLITRDIIGKKMVMLIGHTAAV